MRWHKKASRPFAREREAAKVAFRNLCLFQHGQARALILDDLVACRQGIQHALLFLTSKKIQIGDAAIRALLRFKMQEIFLARLFAFDAECHDRWSCLGEFERSDGVD